MGDALPRWAPAPDPSAVALLGAASVDAALRAFVDEEWAHTTDEAWAEAFAMACPVPGRGPRDYLQRCTRLGEHEVLHGIRFLGGDVARPFVDVVGTDAPLVEVVPAVARAWAPFRPERVRVRASGTQTPVRGATVDQWVLAGRPTGAGRVALMAARADEAVRWAEATLAAWTARAPWMQGRVFPLDVAQAQACAAVGGLRWVVHDGTTVGLWGVRRGQLREWTGWEVVEQIVAPVHGGRGWAAHAQAAWGAEHPDDVVFGTIDGANAASLRTAERAGRQRVGAWWWCPVTPQGETL